MEWFSPSAKRSLTVFGVFAVTALLAYGSANIGGSIQSTPYPARSANADSLLNRHTNGNGSKILDGVITKVKARAEERWGNPMNVARYNEHLDSYLAKVDKLDNATRTKIGPDYEFIFQYVYPRVAELKKPVEQTNAMVASPIGTVFACDTKPGYLTSANAVFTEGTPTSKAWQAWQNANRTSACYYSCKKGYGGSDCTGSRKNIVLVINSSIFPKIEKSIDTFRDDLAKEWYAVYVIADFNESSSPNSIKDQLVIQHNVSPVDGIILVWKMPYAEATTSKCDMLVQYDEPRNLVFPSDAFYWDFKSAWKSSTWGPYDDISWTNLDAWVSRIDLSNIFPLQYVPEERRIIDYFEKNHAYRTGASGESGKALYLEWDRIEMSNLLDSAYPNNSIFTKWENTFDLNSIKKIMEWDYEMLVIWAHSSPVSHDFGPSAGWSELIVSSQDVKSFDIKARIILDGWCSTSRHITPDFINWVYLYSWNVLVVLWNSRDAINEPYDPVFLSSVGSGETIGASFKKWYNSTASSNNWFVGLNWCKNQVLKGTTILGDGTLKISKYRGK